MTNSVIDIVMALDNNYLFPAAVTILSALKNADESHSYHFHIICEEYPPEEYISVFDEIADTREGSSVEFVLLDLSDFKDCGLPPGCSRLTFARLYIAEIFADINECIYLDCDLLVTDDIAKLYRMSSKLKDQYVLAAPDVMLLNGEGEYFTEFWSKLGVRIENYFNAGVMVMNLKKFREDRLMDLFRSYAKSKFPFGDQDILNICLQGHVGMLPVRWNYAYSTIGLNTIENGCSKCDKEDIRNRNASIIHFAGLEKPWKHVDNRWEMMWYRYALQLPKSKLTEKYIKGLNEISNVSDCYEMGQISSSYGRIILYGFTYISRDLIDRASALGMSNISCFCDRDRNKQGTVYKGIPCISAEEMIENLQDEDIIVICSQKAWKEIYKELRDHIGDRVDVVRYVARGYELVGCE